VCEHAAVEGSFLPGRASTPLSLSLLPSPPDAVSHSAREKKIAQERGDRTAAASAQRTLLKVPSPSFLPPHSRASGGQVMEESDVGQQENELSWPGRARLDDELTPIKEGMGE